MWVCRAGVGMPNCGSRLIVELSSLYVACDDCGHARLLRLRHLRETAAKGVHTFQELCRKIRCGQCPPQPSAFRNLTIRPTWFDENEFTPAREKLSCGP